MREIKFRGFNRKNNVWLHGFYLQNRKAHFVAPDEFAYGKTWEDYEIDPETLGQYTGLKDRNGKEIYEGDIVLSKGYLPDREEKRKVIIGWGAAGWRRFPVGGGAMSFSDWAIDSPGILEVIGNQYDNPELLKNIFDVKK